MIEQPCLTCIEQFSTGTSRKFGAGVKVASALILQPNSHMQPRRFEVDGQTVGYFQVLDKDDRIHVQNIAGSHEFQAKGIGTQILKECQLKAAARHVSLLKWKSSHVQT